MKTSTGIGLLLALAAGAASAEPYLAIRSGLKCAACHTNPTGGGQRTAFGNIYAQHQLPAQPSTDTELWTGSVLSRFTVGSDARIGATQFENSDRDDNLEFDVENVTVYAGARLNEHVSLYVDQRVAPGGSSNREAWIKLERGAFYAKAGRIFLPFGWRVEDNTAFIREVTGVNMNQGDDGIEFGYGQGRLDAQLAVTNGAGGGGETDDGKLFTTRLSWTQPNWQVGVSGYHNNTDFEDRTMAGVFAGLNTGPITWLAEFDYIEDEDEDGNELDQWVAFLEANWMFRRGHVIKLTLETHRFDAGELEDRDRGSLVYEVFPWSFTQLRFGVRSRESDEDDAFLNSEEAFIQLHAYF